MTWAFQPQMVEGELLSAYLSRTAHAHGATPGGFCRRHISDGWYFTRDVDRGIATAHHRRIAELAGLSLEAVNAMTLRALVDILELDRPAGETPAAVTPWINAVGIKQAKRRFRALSYCPECLEQDGIVRQCWRLSFHTWCSHHGKPLLDACARCSAAFVPHLTRRSLRNCHACGDLRRRPVSASTPGDAADLQDVMDALIGSSFDGSRESIERLQALRTLVSIGLNARHGKPIYAPVSSAHVLRKYARLETLDLAARAAVMVWLGELVSDWPQSFRRLAESIGLTQRTFARTGVPNMVSDWLRGEVEALPEGHTKRRVRATDALAEKIAASQQAAIGNWRAKRAEILMLEANRHGR